MENKTIDFHRKSQQGGIADPSYIKVRAPNNK
jgi:hypothetical protein